MGCGERNPLTGPTNYMEETRLPYPALPSLHDAVKGGAFDRPVGAHAMRPYGGRTRAVTPITLAVFAVQNHNTVMRIPDSHNTITKTYKGRRIGSAPVTVCCLS